MKKINKTSVYPTLVSIFGAVICVIAAILVSRGWSLALAAIVYATGSAFDAIDGRLARIMNPGINNKLGAFIDSICDKFGEVAFLTGLMFRATSAETIRVLGITTLLGLLTSYVKAVSLEHGIRVDWSEVRVFGRGLRIAIIVVGLLITSVLRVEQDEGIFNVSLMLCCFNLMTFASRISRVLGAQSTEHIE